MIEQFSLTQFILTEQTLGRQNTLIDKINNTGFLIDIAVPNAHNLQTTIAEQLAKYRYRVERRNNQIVAFAKSCYCPNRYIYHGSKLRQLHHSLSSLNLPANTYHLLQKAAILNTCKQLLNYNYKNTYD